MAKFVARGQTPWKLILQFVKVLLITTQVHIFGNFRYANNQFYRDSHAMMNHLFLQKYMASIGGGNIIYDKDSFYKVKQNDYIRV